MILAFFASPQNKNIKRTARKCPSNKIFESRAPDSQESVPSRKLGEKPLLSAFSYKAF
jgi:hypothetical protein